MLCGATRIPDFGGAESQYVGLMFLLSFLVTPKAIVIAQCPSVIEERTQEVLTLYD